MLQTCLHPRKIYVNGEVMFVPCGHCIACEHKRASAMAHRLQDECDFSASTLFCTLSYDNVNVPTYTLNREHSYFYSNRKNLNSFNSYAYSSIPSSLIKVPRIANFPYSSADTFAVVCKADVQKFLKRLRRLLSYDKENLLSAVPQESRRFRYFVCSEYGPKTLRPHYHALLFFSSVVVSDAVEKFYFHKAWKQCSQLNAPIERVIGGAAKYVSAYVNVNVKLPYLLRLPETRTFVLCSKKPAIGTRLVSASDFYRAYTQRSFFTYKSFVDPQGELVSLKLPFSRILFNRFTAEPCLTARFDYNYFLQILNRFYSKFSTRVDFVNKDFDFILKVVNDYVPNYCNIVNTRYSLYDYKSVYDTEFRYVKLNDLPENIDFHSDLYWLGLYQNRYLVTKALAFCLSVDITPFDYVVMHRDIHTFLASESIHTFADSVNDVTFDNSYDALQYVVLCYPTFVSSLPDTYCFMTSEEEDRYNCILSAFCIDVSDFYDEDGVKLSCYDDEHLSVAPNSMPHYQQFLNDLISRSVLDKHNRKINDDIYNSMCNF